MKKIAATIGALLIATGASVAAAGSASAAPGADGPTAGPDGTAPACVNVAQRRHTDHSNFYIHNNCSYPVRVKLHFTSGTPNPSACYALGRGKSTGKITAYGHDPAPSLSSVTNC